MLFNRVQLTGAGQELPTKSMAGSGFLGNIKVTEVATDANVTLTIAQMAGGAINYTGFTAGRNLTTPTAAQILAAAPDMDVGDSFAFVVSIQDAFAGTWVAGTNVSLAGRATVPASGWALVVVEKTAATTVKWTVL